MDLKQKLTSLGKKGNLSVTKAISTFIGITVLFLVIAELLPEAQAAGDTLNATGGPLTGLFAGNGVVFTIVMAGVLLAVIAVAMKSKR